VNIPLGFTESREATDKIRRAMIATGFRLGNSNPDAYAATQMADLLATALRSMPREVADQILAMVERAYESDPVVGTERRAA
jgi:hypothetical protein